MRLDKMNVNDKSVCMKEVTAATLFGSILLWLGGTTETHKNLNQKCCSFNQVPSEYASLLSSYSAQDLLKQEVHMQQNFMKNLAFGLYPSQSLTGVT
jgi:hypothetical protein